jgi:hypothetical protein
MGQHRAFSGRVLSRGIALSMATTLSLVFAAPSIVTAATSGQLRGSVPQVSDQPQSTGITVRPPVLGETTIAGATPPGFFEADPAAQTNTTGAGEPSIAVDPVTPTHLAINSGFNGWGGGASNVGLFISTDGGVNWSRPGNVPPPPGRAVTGTTCNAPCDTTIDYGRGGRLYGTFLIQDGAGNTNVVTGSTTNPTSVAAWQWNGNPAQLTNANLNSADQPWLLVNRDPAVAAQDNAYVAYDDFGGRPDGRVAVSLGAAPVNFARDNIAGNESPGVTNPGLRMASDPTTGTMYALYETSTGAGQPKTVTYHLNRTTDAGATWTLNLNPNGITIDTVPSDQTNSVSAPFKFGTVNALLGGVDHAAVDPTNGDVYVVYGRDPGTGRNQIVMRRVTFVGGVASPPGPMIPISSQAGDAALPSIAIAADRTIGILYDTFDGFSPAPGNFPIFSAHFARSTDQGATFTDVVLQQFLSPATDNGNNRQRVLGDYQQLKAVGNTFYGVFSGNGLDFGRATSQIDPIFFTTAAGAPAGAPAATITPKPVNFGNVTVGSSASQTVTLTSSGTAPLNVTNIAVANTPPFSRTGGTCPPTPFTLPAAPGPGNSCTVIVTFSPTTAGAANGTLTFTDNAPDSPQVDPLQGNGVNGPLTVVGPPANFTINQCATFSGPLGSFSDPAGGPAGAFTVKINWGDGTALDTTTGTVTQTGPNTFQVSGTHTFTSPGTFTVSTTITAPDGRTLTLTTKATVTAVPFQAVSDGDPISGVEGQIVSGITGRFQGPSCATGTPTATIDWGDGSGTFSGTVTTSTSNGVATYEVRGSHTYKEESPAGGYQILTTLTQGALTAAAKDTAVITDAPIHATASPTGVNNGRAAGEVTGTPGTPSTGGLATFTDDNPFGMIGDFTATVDWGDGATTSGSITGPAGPSSGPWQVTGSHQYDCPGTYNVRVIVKDDGGSTDTVVTTATVMPPTNALDMLINLIRCA